MSCNAIELKTSEILNSTFRSRVFELTIPADNRNPANDIFTAKVKIKGTEILEIPGNIVGNRVIFQLTELEDTNKFTDYEIDYWANLDVLGKELFAQEQLRVASKVQPDRCTPDVVAGTLNFGDVVVQAQVTMPVLVLEQHTNNYLDFDSLTPEQKEELTGPPGAPLTFEDLTPEQKEEITGPAGYTPQKGVDYFDGEDGEPFTYDDLTPEQIEELQQPATYAAALLNAQYGKLMKYFEDVVSLDDGETLLTDDNEMIIAN